MSKSMQIITYIEGAAFLIIAFGLVFGSHYFIYRSVIHYFKVTEQSTKVSLGWMLFFLSVSFIIASIIAHSHDNVFTRGFYFLSSLWMGILTNLVMAFFFVRVAEALAGFSQINLNLYLVGTLAILAASAFSAYGVFNAYNQQITHITVKIKNLPPEWQGKTVVQMSDIHIGHVFDKYFLKKIVDMANSQNPEAVFITGDLFDGMDGTLDTQIEPINDLKAAQGVYFITGNHETYFGVKKVFDILKKTQVRILNDEMVNLKGLELIGLSYPERGEVKDITSAIKKTGFDPAKPNILLYHSPTHIDEIKNLGINLQLAGHTHEGQIFPFGFITHLVYKGYDYGLHEEGDYTEYTTNGTGAWGPTMRTLNTPEIVAIKLEKK